MHFDFGKHRMLGHMKSLGLAGPAALTLAGFGGNVAIRADHVPPIASAGALASTHPVALKVTEFRDQRFREARRG